MEKLVTSEFKLGIIAGGQLGKMLVLAASNWDVKTYILDNDEHCPASSCCTKLIKGDPKNFEDVYNLGKMVDMLTFEIENVNVDALDRLLQEGASINPSPLVLRLIQDKGLQKEFFASSNLPSSSFTLFQGKNEILDAAGKGELQFPFVQKLRKGGYDGRGVAVIKKEEDLHLLLDGGSVVEELVEIQKEISVIAARNRNGEIKCFPPVEMEFNENANLVEMLLCPAVIPDGMTAEAIAIAEKVISSLNVCGILAVEMFIDKKGRIWINEVAPRPHNSGHHTIESIITSQFEQHLRAIFNFALGSTKIKLPSVMINILGEPGFEGNVKYEGLSESMKVEGVKIHLYGKRVTKPFRKMGHVTVLAGTIEEAKARAEFVKNNLKVKSC